MGYSSVTTSGSFLLPGRGGDLVSGSKYKNVAVIGAENEADFFCGHRALRVRALLRRVGTPDDGILEVGGIRMDLNAHQITIQDSRAKLGPP